MSEAGLGRLRDAIDRVDERLLGLLNERAGLARQVGELKQRDGATVFRPDREAAVINRLQARGGALRATSIAHIWREIMSACRVLEGAQRVAFLGPVGTFSQQAAHAVFGTSVVEVPGRSLEEVFRAVEGSAADFAVVPIENSVEGFVTRTLDLLDASPAHMVAEAGLIVRHQLLRATAGTDGVTAVLAHPQALAQCAGWLSDHLPDAERRPVASNAEGARQVRERPDWAAIASERAGVVWGLHTVAPAIQDDTRNHTRFAVICLPDTLAQPVASGRDATSLAVSIQNRPGALHDLLTSLKAEGVDMVRFLSRPARDAGRDYVFFIDLAGHRTDPAVAAALASLGEAAGASVKVLGSYPRAD